MVDNILEQSLNVVNNQIDEKNDSLSDNFAITSDLSCQGIEFIKSNTIESISGKSFEDEHITENAHELILNESVNDYDITQKQISVDISSQLNVIKKSNLNDVDSDNKSNLEFTRTNSTAIVSSSSVDQTCTTTITSTDVVITKTKILPNDQGENKII